MNNREKTNYLKCFAILAVCGNHFVNGYISKNFMGYANGFISVFFVLSGYGIFLSLDKHNQKSFTNFTTNFFKKRVFRIYPLFWFRSLIYGSYNGILGIFALDFIYTKSPWFIPAILQCYIITIPLYLFCKRIKINYQLIIIFSIFLVTNALLFGGDYSPIRAIGYRGLFFLHIFQFYLGFVLAQIKSQSLTLNFRNFNIISICIFLFFIQETTAQSFLYFQGKDFLFPILFSFSTFLLCYTFLRSKFNSSIRVFNFIGTYTYSIYLLHEISFKVLSKLGIIQRNSTELIGALIWILTLPLFILVFAAIETALNEIIFGKCSPKNAINSYLKSMQIDR